MVRASESDFAAIRRGLQRLPRTAHHSPGGSISPDEIVLVPTHRAALDPDRALVIGNRGVGKSFWAHALADRETRVYVARTFRELTAIDVLIGFNASSRIDPVAPTEDSVNSAFQELGEADSLWRTVLVRATWQQGIARPPGVPLDFVAQSKWVRGHGEQVDRMLTELDDQYEKRKQKLVIVFDALDRLGTDWQAKRSLASALLRRALAARSYRAIRLKLFMRRDQFEDPLLFQFPDGSKVANERVELLWNSSELYTLLFSWLARDEAAASALSRLMADRVTAAKLASDDIHQHLVTLIAGEFMGATPKRGRVYTWLPLHLSDARGEASPRTFLTAWREAANYQPAPARRALDHRGIHEGVRKASEDRLQELEEDYWWISLALAPLNGQHVPMERAALKRMWSDQRTGRDILSRSGGQLPPVRLDTAQKQRSNLEDALISDLVAIGIIEDRPNDKINIPDIFRLEAGIKRKGGVSAPQNTQRR
jgi:hypothetical protein